MKKLFILIFLSSAITFASHFDRSDTIKVSELWNVDTVRITGNLVIDNGVTIVISPGVRVEFQGHYSMYVNGQILAVGNTSNYITFTIFDTTGFSNTAATQGGWHGIRFYNTPSSNDTSVFCYCKMEYGKAIIEAGDYTENFGGAFFARGFDKIKILNSIISHNYASSSGGGLFIDGSAIIINNIVQNNQANSDAGGCYLEDVYKFNNNLIMNNKAQSAGGIFFQDNSTYFINNTICNNQANYGGGLYFQWDSDVNVVNCIIWENRTVNAGDQVYINNDNGDPSFYYCDIEGDSSAFEGNGAHGNYHGNYQNNTNLDPLFIGIGQHPYSLTNISPCINAGDPTYTISDIGTDTDLAGNPRIYSGAKDIVDIGAYEYQGDPPAPEINLSCTQIDFGNIDTSQTQDTTFSLVITNIGASDLIINNLYGLATPFSINSIPLPDTIASSNDSLVVLVTLDRSLAGSFKDTLVISNNDEEKEVYISANLQIPSAKIFIDNHYLDFGTSYANSVDTSLSFVIKNVGGKDLLITDLTGLTMPFLQNLITYPDTIKNTNDSLLVTIYLDRNIPGNFNDTLIVANNDATAMVICHGEVIPLTSIDNLIPFEYALHQNYPNPFNPETKISYSLAKESKVVLKIYDILGNEVATLVNETKPAGNYKFTFNTSKYQLSSGVYLYKLTADDFVSVKKMILMK